MSIFCITDDKSGNRRENLFNTDGCCPYTEGAGNHDPDGGERTAGEGAER